MKWTDKQYARRSLIAMCVMLATTTGIAWNTFTLYAEPIVREWGITNTQFMFSLTILAVTNALLSIFAFGPVVSKLGVRKLLLYGGIVLTGAIALLAMSNSLAMLYAAAFLYGVGVTALNANSSVMIINSWYKQRVGTLVSIPTTCGSVMGILAASVYGALIAALNWRIPMWITCGIMLVVTFLIQFLYRGTPEEVGARPMYADEADDTESTATADSENGVSFTEMLRSASFYILVLAYLLIGALGYAAMGNLALIMPALGHGALSGTVISVALLGSAVTMVLCGSLMDRLGSRWLVVILLALISAAMLLLSISVPPLPVIYAAAALLGIGYNICLIPAGIVAKEIFGTRDYGKKVGIFIGACYIGVAFGATILTSLADRMGAYRPALHIFVILAVITMALNLLGTRKKI